MIKRVVVLIAFSIIGWNTPAISAEKHYEIRADGLACPYCAYGIEKKFMKISGVNHVDIKLKEGLVVVSGDADLELKDPQLKTLFNDAGFTYRKIVKVDIRP